MLFEETNAHSGQRLLLSLHSIDGREYKKKYEIKRMSFHFSAPATCIKTKKNVIPAASAGHQKKTSHYKEF